MRRLVLIQPDSDERRTLEACLRQAGYLVDSASGGHPGLELVQRNRPHLVLLHWALPDLSGPKVCKLLKSDARSATASIVILSDQDSEMDRVIAFELGADAYLVRPIDQQELVLRIAAILRRMGPVATQTSLEEFGRLRIDRSGYRVWIDGREASLTALEFRLLLVLYGSRGRIKSRAALLHEVWQAESDARARTVDQQIKRLREHLGPAGSYIETVRGEGYRFVATPEAIQLPGTDLQERQMQLRDSFASQHSHGVVTAPTHILPTATANGASAGRRG